MRRDGLPDGSTSTAWTPASTRPTGGRIHRSRERLEATRFCATYSDGVADIDLAACSASTASTAPREHDRRPAELQFGVAELNGDGHVAASRRSRASTTGSTAASSASSPRRSTTWPRTACSSASRWSALAAGGQLRAYRHSGFWNCMDTYKDAVVLNDLWAGDRPPWRLW